MPNIKRVSLDELRAKRNRGEISSPENDLPASDMPDGFWDDAELVLPQPKQAISMRVDQDVLDYFKSQGSGHLTRMHAVLKAYVEAQKKRAS